MKKMSLTLIFVVLLFISFLHVNADNEDKEILLNHYDSSIPITFKNSEEPISLFKTTKTEKQQFRGMYVYTNENLDISKQKSIGSFKEEYLKILDLLEENHMNTIIFQIRPLNDAFYKSELNPWSRFLIGVEGVDPGWDPLKWMISATHAKGIDFYAGINAFRVSNPTNLDQSQYISSLSNDNYAFKHPEHVLKAVLINGDNQYFLNPNNEDVRQFIIDSIMEIIHNYDVDAINIENFYYPMNSFNDINDIAQFNQIGDDKLSLEEWRRGNITDLIKNIKEEVDFYNRKMDKRIQLGITPYGVWDHYSDKNKNGSLTSGYSSYDNQYADTKAWIKKGYVDYVAPQIKWEFEDSEVPYADIVKWWANLVRDSHVNLYIGHFIDSEMTNPNQILDQFRFNQNYEEIKGSFINSYHSINVDNSNIQTLVKEIQTKYWKQISLHPSALTIDDTPPKSVDRLLVKYVKNKVRLSWNKVDDAKCYLIYRFQNDDEVNLNDTKNIIKILYHTSNEKVLFIDEDITENNIYRYIIVTIDDAYNESVPVVFDIDLYPNDKFSKEIIIFSIISFISLTVISLSAYITLKKRN